MRWPTGANGAPSKSDKPRGWILADEALYALATRDPVSIAALESDPDATAERDPQARR